MTVNGATTNYLYNALGERIEKSGGPAGTILYCYDERGHLLGEYTSEGALIEETVWLGDTPVATLQPNGSGTVMVYYIHADHLGSPKMITRPTDNAILWRWDEDPFGSAAPNQNPSEVGTFTYNPRLPGQYYDQETGLNQNYSRDYDPAVGRYVESDLLGLKAGINTYGYVDARVLTRVDPLGLAPLSYSQIADLVQQNNHSGLPDQLIICLLWNESSFDPNAGGGRINTGNGLAGITRIATEQVNSNLGYTAYLYSSWSDPSWSIDVGSRYLNWVFTSLTPGDVTAALQRYGTGDTYPAAQIQGCAECLKGNATGEAGCSKANPQHCLDTVHK